MIRSKMIPAVKIALTLVVVLCIAYWGFNKFKNMSMKKYKWEPTSNAPILFPVKIHVAYMRYGENSALAVAGSDNTGLGDVGSTYGLEGAFPLPTGLDVIWLSWVDKKFYRAEVDFPMEQITRFFEEGYINFKGEKENYKWVNACFLPGGRIVVYLTGYEKGVVLAEYQGKETTVEMKDFIPDGYFAYKNWNEYFKDRFDHSTRKWVSNYHANGVPYGLWDRYFERFNYDVKFEFENKQSVDKGSGYDFTNGEQGIIAPLYSPGMPITPAARVRVITNEWTVGEHLYSAWFYFNEQEVLDVFDKAFKGNPEQKGELKIWVSKYNNLFDISLTVAGREYKFEKTQIRVFKEPKEKPEDAELIYISYEGNHDLFLGE